MSSRHRSRVRVAALRAYRLAVLVGIFVVAHQVVAGARAEEARPISLREVRTFLPAAEQLTRGGADPAAWHVLDAGGAQIGTALRTSPLADDVTGYAGPSDVLVVLDPAERILGLELRRSLDTPGHVADVVDDTRFWDALTGRSREDVLDPDLAVDAVTGATRTSTCIVESVRKRLSPEPEATAPIVLRRHDWVLLGGVVWLAFVTLGRGALRGRLRLALRAGALVYLGILAGDMLALSLTSGWTAAGAPWRAAPGMFLLGLCALTLPLFTGRDAYCQHACPFGTLQEWILAKSPRRWRRRVPDWLEPGLASLPATLLAVGLVATLLGLSIDLADVEPFDAFVWGAAGTASTILFALGLVLAPIVPMATCRYACPTGALLRYARTGHADRFRVADLVAGGLLILAATTSAWSVPLWSWFGVGT